MNTYFSMDEEEKLWIRNQIHSSFPIIQAVIDGVQQGQIFSNSQKDYWVLHKAGFSEVFLRTDNGIELVEFINENHQIPRYFHIYNPPIDLTNIFRSKTKAFNVRERGRVQLKYNVKKLASNSHFVLKDEYIPTQVTQDNFDSLDVFNLNLANKFWNGKKEFVEKGFGVFLKDKKDNPVSLCYAAAIAGNKAEIDVVTSEKYRGMGLAKSVVNSFISNCINSKIIPNWDCFDENIISKKTALSLNFVVKYSYLLISIYKNDGI